MCKIYERHQFLLTVYCTLDEHIPCRNELVRFGFGFKFLQRQVAMPSYNPHSSPGGRLTQIN
jgi:hypothetical protein